MKRVESIDNEMKRTLKAQGLNRKQIRAEMKKLNKVYKKIIPIYEDAKEG